MSRIIDEVAKCPTTDPKNVELGNELLNVLAKRVPVIPMFCTSKFVPVNATYWTNHLSAKIYYKGLSGGRRTANTASRS